ncbi:hypothetical protein [Abyssalbus ytuae]|uniref:Uncharacterized protein n=1 Tax=Abyssalbus ytuae TaxID=2926907 RepID=A0A9E7CTF4_9FLAO|nr:hypothetical protein [Abyssalbus ytuae]UOB16077.1 hypothetical protein MQE35_10035 [Abyssalbus ytuae]
MKNLKKYLFLACTLMFVGAYAQKNVDVLEETVKKTYQVEKNGKITTYVVKINTTETQPVKLEKEDKGKLNQDRELDVPVDVDQTVTVDNYNANDMKVELSYKRNAGEELRFASTSKGLAIISSDNRIHHIDDTGVYYIYAGDDVKDVVIVEEFETLK